MNESAGEMTLEGAKAVAEAVLRQARARSMPPMAVAVLDRRGVTRCLLSEDGSSLIRPQIAEAKAWSALAMNRSTRALAKLAEAQPPLIGGLISISEGKMVPAAGGVLIADGDGKALGAVGVTGDVSDTDEECALAALAELGLSQPG